MNLSKGQLKLSWLAALVGKSYWCFVFSYFYVTLLCQISEKKSRHTQSMFHTSPDVRLVVVPHLDQMWAHRCNEWGVSLHHWGEPHSKLGLTETSALEHHFRLLTPGDKEAVILHSSYHIIDLLHGIPGERESSKNSSRHVCRSACQSGHISWCDITLRAGAGKPVCNSESFIYCTVHYITSLL